MGVADDRLALMDETWLDIQVLSLTTPGIPRRGPESIETSRRTSDAVAAAAARHPTRFQALATLSVVMPEEAALGVCRTQPTAILIK